MKFQVSTKPLSDALSLGVINGNVSKFYQKSCLAQVVATRNTLTINLEASQILTELRLKGSGDADNSGIMFVDSLLFKQLVSTLESPTVTLEFVEGGLILHSGKSKFNLPKWIDVADMELKAPRLPEYTSTSIPVDKSDWRFIKDRQMFAIAMSFIHPVYTKVWVGDSGDVLVGDFDNSLFTHSKKNKLGNTCLLSDTIINLFNSIPEGASLIKVDSSYLIQVKTDGYEYLSEFRPKYESDESEGSYNSDIILQLMEHPMTNCIKLPTAAVHKFLNQAELLSTSTEDQITFEVANKTVTLHDSNVDCKVDIAGDTCPYTIQFKTSLLKSVISNYKDEAIMVSPMIQPDENGNDTANGIVVWDEDLTTVIAGVN